MQIGEGGTAVCSFPPAHLSSRLNEGIARVGDYGWVPFSILQNAQVRHDFLAAINTAVANAPFTLVTAIIDKRRLTRKSAQLDNPYEIALTFCMERVFSHLQGLQQHQVTTTMVVECRGRKEDADLELSFRRTTQGNNTHDLALPF